MPIIQSRLSDLVALGRHKRPGATNRRHVIELAKYAMLSFAAGQPGFEMIQPPKGSTNPGKGSRWDHFSSELSYAVRHIHPRDYLRAPVVARTTANPRKSPATRVAPVCWAEDTVKELSAILSKAYPIATAVQWQNLLARSQCTTEGLFKSATLAPELYRDTRIIELGSGFGAHSFVNAERSRNQFGNLNFDLPEMLALQQNVVRYLRFSSGNSTLCEKLGFTSSHDELFEQAGRAPYAVVSHYAFTEFSMAERERMTPLIAGASFVCIVANQQYEGVSNADYVAALAQRVGKTLHSGPVCNPNQESHTRYHTAYLLV